MGNGLQRIDKAYQRLIEAETIQDVKAVKDAAEALRYTLNKAEASREMYNAAAELKLRAERKLGGMLADMPKNKGAKGSGSNQYLVRLQDATAPTLKELGIEKTESMRTQTIAALPESEFQAYIDKTKKEGKEITTAAVLRMARPYKQNGDDKKEPEFSSIIKPMDNWTFSSPHYSKPEHVNGKTGYIVGDIYANAFWYYVNEGDIVVDPMAGSGLAKWVYEDRATWMKEHEYEFELHLFDLSPQQSFIKQHDLLDSFPLPHADYIFMDIPYYDMVRGEYSDKFNDLANMDLDEWVHNIGVIAENCAKSQQNGGLCSVLSPNWRDVKTGQKFMATHQIAMAWGMAGYSLVDKAYCTRRIQQTQSAGMAILNNKAKRNKIMLTDISELLTFERLNAWASDKEEVR